MIIVFTGNGKGKTTAALGQAIRALGQKKRVLMIQFIKGPWKSGEDYFAAKLKIQLLRSKSPEGHSRFQIIKSGKGFVKILGDKLPFSAHRKAAAAGLKTAEKAIRSGKWDLIIFDEINVAVGLKLIKAAEVLKILQNLPETKTVILTGRDAPKSFIKIADLVTEMKEIKHPFQKNKAAEKGVDF
ncbi:cob(I)yrinic acid a,c-diamide adenosyltransferase [Candidatus Wolfebacteria bacterium]|nr:cob(I)yrinic acid a,c-diamide adenosyltransferase [Candidatus Wolfebacteria bacterium]